MLGPGPRLQLLLPLAEFAAPVPGWEGLDPDRRAEAVSTLARLMVEVLNPQAEEEHDDDPL